MISIYPQTILHMWKYCFDLNPALSSFLCHFKGALQWLHSACEYSCVLSSASFEELCQKITPMTSECCHQGYLSLGLENSSSQKVCVKWLDSLCLQDRISRPLLLQCLILFFNLSPESPHLHASAFLDKIPQNKKTSNQKAHQAYY